MNREPETEPIRLADVGDPGAGFAVGDEFAGHRIDSELGRGGMGIVYRARHLVLDRERALKVIAPALSDNSQFRARFRREARAAASIEHPNIVSVHHAGEEAGRLYLSMRVIGGPDLGGLVEAEGPLAPQKAASIVRAIAAGLDFAHERGLVHCDVKPSNVLVEGAGDDQHVYLTDFGISHLAGGEGGITTTGEFLGSPDYVAPEQVQGPEVDRRADIYSLGGVAHYLLTGEPPFPRRSGPAKLVAHAGAPRPRPTAVVEDLPRETDAAISRAMAVRPEDRFSTAGEFADAFERATRGLREHPGAQRAGPSGTRVPRRLALAGSLVALALVTLALIVAGSGDNSGTEGALVSEIEVGGEPIGVAVGPLRVWVASRSEPTVAAIHPRTDGVEQQRPSIAGQARSVALGFNSVWVVDSSADELVRFDTTEPERAPVRIPVGRKPADVALDDRGVWVTNEGDDTVSRVDPARNEVDAVVPVGDGPRAIATGAGGVWVASLRDGSVSRIDPAAAVTVGDPIEVGLGPTDLAVSPDSVWVVQSVANSLRRIDVEAMATRGGGIKVGIQPRGVALGLGDIWVANGGDDTVSRVDADTGDVVGSPIQVGHAPTDIAFGGGAIWTANFADASVSRIEPELP